MSRNREQENIYAVVLMGGLSSRFGTPKGNVYIDGEVQWRRIELLLMNAMPHIKVYFSLNASTRLYYPDIPEERIIEDNEILGAKGPMLGLMSAFYCYSHTILLISIDMFLLQARTIQHLFEQYTNQNAEQKKLCTAYKTNKIQPLCAIYTPEIIPYLDTVVHNAKSKSDYSLYALIQTLAKKGDVCFIETSAMNDTDDYILESLTHINDRESLEKYYSNIQGENKYERYNTEHR